nr:MAG TPA: hypothetical protein [Caudoviricetes sp.]
MASKGFYSALAVNAFNQGNDQQALQYAMLGYDGSVQNIQQAISERNFKKQMQQQQEEMSRKTEEMNMASEQANNQNQKAQSQSIRRNPKENSSNNNITQGTQNTGTWLKKALGGNNTNNSEEWY